MTLSALRGVFEFTFMETIKSKWFLLFSVVFFFLAFNLPFATLQILNLLPRNYMPSFISLIITVSFPFIPLLPLPLAAVSIVEERELGVLQFTLTGPITKEQYLLGRFMGLLAGTTFIIACGFGIAALIAFRDMRGLLSIGSVTIASLGLNTAMISIALAISVYAKKRGTALSAAIFAWFVFVVISNSTLLATLLAAAGRGELLLPFIAFNPVEASRLLAVFLIGGSIGDLGSSGQIMKHLFPSDVIMVLSTIVVSWIIASLVLAFTIFNITDY